MAQPNKVSFTINEENLKACKDLVAQLCANLLPLLIPLTPEDRQELPKMGDKTVAFVRKVLDYSRQNPDLVPQFMSVDDLDLDVKAVETLLELFRPLSQLTDALSDTILLSGSEAYSGSLMFYNNAKYAAKSNVVKAATIYNDLAARFPRGKKQTAPPEA